MNTSIKTIGIALFACATALFAGGASAVPVVYEGYIPHAGTVMGTVPAGDGWISNEGGEVDFWRFHAIAGDEVTIHVHPLDAGFDPAFSFYLGTTSADTSLFDNIGDWGGLTVLGFGATPLGIGGEDADWTFTAADEGLFTIAVGGWQSVGAGPFAYQITVSGNTPEPMTLALMGIGIAAIGVTRRRTTRKTRHVKT